MRLEHTLSVYDGIMFKFSSSHVAFFLQKDKGRMSDSTSNMMHGYRNMTHSKFSNAVNKKSKVSERSHTSSEQMQRQYYGYQC